MILALEYITMKNEARESLASLYGSFLKRVDYQAEKSEESWARSWKKYREGEEIGLNGIIEKMPEWMQIEFQHFANQQRFNREIEKAFIEYEQEISTTYKIGYERGLKTANTNSQKHFMSHGEKEDMRLKTIFSAQQKWPELFN